LDNVPYLEGDRKLPMKENDLDDGVHCKAEEMKQ
jgi:hypothetical protein